MTGPSDSPSLKHLLDVCIPQHLVHRFASRSLPESLVQAVFLSIIYRDEASLAEHTRKLWHCYEANNVTVAVIRQAHHSRGSMNL